MATTTWALDPTHSDIQFKIKHLMITNVSGSFNLFDINATTEEEDFTKAAISFSAQVNSINTNNTQRDAHLVSADFFDAAQYPTINFVAKKADDVDHDGSYNLHGDLTIKGITKPVVLSVEFGGVTKDMYGNTKAGFTINGKINRTDFGLTWNAALETGGVLVSEEVKIMSEIQLIKQA